MKLEHIAINVADPVRLAAWYVEHLQFNIARGQNEPPYAHFLADMSGQTVLEVYNNPLAEVPNFSELSPYIFHIAFLVDDMEGEHARLINAGATADGDIATTPANDQLAFLRDPWGITLQLVKRSTPLL